MKRTLLFVIGSALSVSAFAQTGPQQAIALVPLGSMPVFSNTSSCWRARLSCHCRRSVARASSSYVSILTVHQV